MEHFINKVGYEPYSKKEHQFDSIQSDVYTVQPSRQSSTHKIIQESQVSGPIFSQLKFKREIDQVGAKAGDDEMMRSPYQDFEISKYNKKKTHSSKNVSSQVMSDFDFKVDDGLRLNLQNQSSYYNSNPKIVSIRNFNEEEEESQQLSYKHDEGNMSMEQTDLNVHNLQRNTSTHSTKNRSQTVKPQGYLNNNNNEENDKGLINQNILSLGVGANTHKKRGSAIFINQPGIAMQQSITDQRKHSIFSLMASNNNIDFRYDSLSPSKLNVQDLNSKGLTSEPGTPSIMKKNRNYNQQGQFQLNLKNASGFIGGELTNAEKSMGDMSAKKQEGFKGVWKKSAFQILTLTKRFINNIKYLTMSYKLSQMKHHYFELIDDKATDYKFLQINHKFTHDQPNLFQQTMYKWKGLFNKKLYINRDNHGTEKNHYMKLLLHNFFNIDIPTILPDQYIKIIWDCFILFLLLINLLYIPMKISFSEVTNFNEYLLVFFDDLPSWAFLGDVILNFNTAYYSKGVIITERSKIFKHYVRGSFFWDLLVVVPFIFSSVYNVRFLNIILLLRTNKILKIIKSIEELLNLQQFETCVLSLGKLIVSIIYIAHICGCFFYYMHVLQIQTDSSAYTWVTKFDMQHAGWLSLYISSVYWAVITMITVGYGDIYPVTNAEKVYVIIVTLLSCGVFAYAVNAIGEIISDMTRSSTQFKMKMSSLNLYMKKRELSNFTQMKVKKYFQYLHDEQHDDNEDGQKLLNQCNNSLKNEVLAEMYSKILQQRKEFGLNFSKEFIQKLAVKMRERRLGPEEIIFKENEFCKRVYFVMRGNVALQRTREYSGPEGKHRMKDINMKILKKGDLFGLESFITGSETNVCAKTQNVVSLVYLRDEDFMQVIQEFQSDKEAYFMIKDKLNLQKACRGSGICCSLCDSFNHQFLNCPYMSYQPNHQKVFQQYIKEEIQKRKEYGRDRIKVNTLSQVYKVQENVIKLLFEYNPYDNINQLLEYLQILDDESALQINTPNMITKYMKDPQEFEDIEDMNDDEEIDQYMKSSVNDGESRNHPINEEDSVRIRRATVGSLMSKPERESEYQVNVGMANVPYIRYGSLKLNKTDSTQLEIPRREERKSSFRKQTQFSTHDQVILINQQDDTTPKRLRQINSTDTCSQKQLNSENIIHTPIITHNVPNSPQLEKNSRYYRTHRSFKEDDESDRHTPFVNYNGGNSQVSIYQLDNMRTVSIKSTKSNRYESKRDIELINQNTNYIQHGSSMVIQSKDFMIINNFEKGHQWKTYFPKNNLDFVLQQHQNLLDKILQEKRKRRRRTNRNHSQKHKQLQMLYSTIQNRNQTKNHSKGYSRNNQTKQSIVSHKDSSIHMIGRNPSQLLGASPRNENREASRSMLSQMDFPSDMPIERGSQHNQ